MYRHEFIIGAIKPMNAQISPQPQEASLGKIIDRMLVVRDERAALNKQADGLKAEFDQLELQVLQKLDEQDTVQGRSKTATATIATQVVPTIKDWEAFESYIINNNALYLLEKRPAGAAFRELMQQGEVIPGLEPYTKTSISLRRL